MKKKKNISQVQGNNGFDGLINVHTHALEENSKEIANMLESLSEKKLSKQELRTLDFIKKELRRLDKEIDNLGEEY